VHGVQRRFPAAAVAVAAAVLLGGCAAPQAVPAARVAAASPRTGQEASPAGGHGSVGLAFRLRDVSGGIVTLPAGRPALLLFGAASGCVSCAASEQMLAQVYPRLGRRVLFVTVDVMPGDTPAEVRAVAQALHAPWPHVLAQGTDLLARFHITALDTMVVLNARGRVVARADSGFSTPQLLAAVHRALRE
jgi:thiol-disulfide isomerase/thioredoxin